MPGPISAPENSSVRSPRRHPGAASRWSSPTVSIPPSPLCSDCEFHNRDLTLKDRQFICPSCGFSIDRDLNAAINLRPVAVMPTETLNARGGNVSPDSNVWQIPMKREPSKGQIALAAT